MQDSMDSKEAKLQEQMLRIQKIEMEVQKREEDILKKKEEVLKNEKSLKEKEKSKKQVLLRLTPSLWDDIAAWADDDFRSINGQIEYLLSEAVRQRKKK